MIHCFRLRKATANLSLLFFRDVSRRELYFLWDLERWLLLTGSLVVLNVGFFIQHAFCGRQLVHRIPEVVNERDRNI